MIQCIPTDLDINELGDLAFQCPVCPQVYEIKNFNNNDHINEHTEFRCVTCNHLISVTVNTQAYYKVRVDAPEFESCGDDAEDEEDYI